MGHWGKSNAESYRLNIAGFRYNMSTISSLEDKPDKKSKLGFSSMLLRL